jgi:serine/threonine protein kinase
MSSSESGLLTGSLTGILETFQDPIEEKWIISWFITLCELKKSSLKLSTLQIKNGDLWISEDLDAKEKEQEKSLGMLLYEIITRKPFVFTEITETKTLYQILHENVPMYYCPRPRKENTLVMESLLTLLLHLLDDEETGKKEFDFDFAKWKSYFSDRLKWLTEEESQLKSLKEKHDPKDELAFLRFIDVATYGETPYCRIVMVQRKSQKENVEEEDKEKEKDIKSFKQKADQGIFALKLIQISDTLGDKAPFNYAKIVLLNRKSSGSGAEFSTRIDEIKHQEPFLYVFMPFYSQLSLRHRLQHLRSLEKKVLESTIWSWCYCILNTLVCYHEIKKLNPVTQSLERKPRIHGNLKPQNLFLDGQNGQVVRIDDPGKLTARTRSEINFHKTIVYLAPEQDETADEDEETLIDEKVDLWATGSILYECMTHKYPVFAGITVDSRLTENLPKTKEGKFFYSDKLISFVKILLSQNPKERPNARDALITVKELMKEQGVEIPSCK